MSLWQSIFLGVIQGITEFLPVSSYGHLVVIQKLMGLGEIPVLFDILLHIATLFVIFIAFRVRIFRIASAVLRLMFHRSKEGDVQEARVFGIIIIGTVFTGGIGLAIQSAGLSQYQWAVFVSFIVTGILLILVSILKPGKTTSDPGIFQGVIIGVAQGLGTLPGISRSGITIAAALWSGIDRKKAGELSFLFFIPAVLGALILELGKTGELAGTVSFPLVAVGMVAAFITGMISLKLLLAVIRGMRLYLFSIYLIPLGIAGLLLF
ncbi:MAG: undecaprenyl-diphosphate phosphatase [Spirochaetales bacterium]|nr:undecaprenyl-diphosphate phosphatase [Spirochaetales bacterium]